MIAYFRRRRWMIVGGLAVGWCIGTGFILPLLIESMYHGRSLPALNGMITRASGNPLSYYTDKAHYLFWLGVPILAVIAVIFSVLQNSSRPAHTLRACWESYWFRPTSLHYLALVRMVCVGTALGLMLPGFVGRFENLRTLAYLPDSLFQPILVLRIFLAPFGGAEIRPSGELIAWAQWFTIAVGASALLGWRTRVALALFAAGNVFLIGYQYSFRDIHHPETIMAIGLALLVLAPIGRVWSVDAWLARRRQSRERVAVTVERVSAFGAWPLLLLQCLIAIVYLDSGIQKLWFSGIGWLNGTTLEYYLVKDALNRGSELAPLVLQQPVLIRGLSLVTIVFETTFWLVLFVPRLAWVYLPIGFGFHLGNAVLNIAGFYEFMALYVVFVPYLTGAWQESPLALWRRHVGAAKILGEPSAVPRVSPGGAPAL